MEPIDRRITAAQLMALRAGANPTRAIAELFSVKEMPLVLAKRTLHEIEMFVASGDATSAAQLIHAAIVRRRKAPASRSATGLPAERER